MSKMDLIKKINELNELEALLEEVKSEAEAVKDSIKAELIRLDTEELEVDGRIIRWTSVLSNRFDMTAFKREHNDLYQQFVKQSASRRFSIA